MTDDLNMNQNAMDRVGTGEMELAGSFAPGRRRLIEIGLFGALVVGAVFAFPGFGDLRDRLAGADPRLIALAALLEIGSCLAFVAAFRGVFSRRLSWRLS
jgi:hypothetical protein